MRHGYGIVAASETDTMLRCSERGVTRAAVEDGFERYVDALVTETGDVFRISRALRGASGPEGAVIDRLLKDSRRVERRIVRPELQAYQRAILRQFEVVLDYATSDAAFDSFADEVLARDLYWDALRADLSTEQRRQIRTTLLERQRHLGDRITPLVAASEGTLWAAAASVYDWEATVDLIESHFALTDPLHANREAYELTVHVDPGDLLGGLARALPSVTIDYTDEALRAMTRAQKRVIDTAKDDARPRFE